jgi:hypothetical protein
VRTKTPDGSQAEHGDRDGADELDRCDQPEGKTGNRQVEGAVHHGQARAQQHEKEERRGRRGLENPPGPGPQGEHRRRTRDAEPGHTEHPDVGEQEHREGGPEIVEDGADHEPQTWGHGRDGSVEPGVRRDHALIMAGTWWKW